MLLVSLAVSVADLPRLWQPRGGSVLGTIV